MAASTGGKPRDASLGSQENPWFQKLSFQETAPFTTLPVRQSLTCTLTADLVLENEWPF